MTLEASPAQMGILSAIGSASVLLFSLLAGVIADRVKRRPIMLAADFGRALLLLASDGDARLRDVASALEITERSAYAIVADLSDAGYVVKEKDGRRNRYHIQAHLPLPDSLGRERTIGELLELLTDAEARRRLRRRP